MHVPLSLALGRFKRLPQRSAEVWQGGLVKLPSWVEDPEDPDATPTRPVAAIWVSLRTGLMHVGLPKEAGQASPQLALEALLEFGLKKAKQLEGRPARLEVRDAAVRDALAEAVADLNTTVVVVDDMPYVSEVLGSFEESEHGDRRPGALEAAGVTLARLRAFADAAALFYEARPWIQIPGDELLVVESPGAPRGMAHLAVLGAGGEQFGVGFFESRREFERIFERPDPRRIRRAHGITFGPITEMPFGDVDAWEDHGLPVAGPLAYPVAADLYADGRFGRLRSPRKRVMTARHVQILDLLLDAGDLSLRELTRRTRHLYTVKNPLKALVRDLNYLIRLEAVGQPRAEDEDYVFSVNLEWPTQITETEFFRLVKELPKGKVHGFLSR